MESIDSDGPVALIASARGGNASDLGKLVSLYRQYLKSIADAQMHRQLRRRVSSSDIVQETLFKAVCHFEQFRGQTEQELVAWLRKILINSIRTSIDREMATQRRDLRREVSIHEMAESADDSCGNLNRNLLSATPSPTEVAVHHEQLSTIEEQLELLPPAYRQVITWRNLEGIEFEEIARRMGRSVNAVRVLWARALRRLSEQNPPK